MLVMKRYRYTIVFSYENKRYEISQDLYKALISKCITKFGEDVNYLDAMKWIMQVFVEHLRVMETIDEMKRNKQIIDFPDTKLY